MHVLTFVSFRLCRINPTTQCGDNHVVEGITAVNAPTYVFNLNSFWTTGCGDHAGSRAVVRRVKGIGWHYTSDGVFTGRDSLIEDSFFKVNDDAIKVFLSNTLVQRCTVWQLNNGQVRSRSTLFRRPFSPLQPFSPSAVLSFRPSLLPPCSRS